jgi:O-antigen/teichoic acid export membrane protein
VLLRAVTGTGIVRGAAMLASFAVGVQLARNLGVSEYGRYGLALSIIAVASIPGELGLAQLVTREASAAVATGNEGTVVGLLRWADRMSWVLTALFGGAAAIVGAVLFFKVSHIVGLAVLLGLPSLPFMAMSRIRGGALQGLRYITLGQIPPNLLRPAIFSALLFALFFFGRVSAPGAMAMYSISAVVVFLVAELWLARRLPRQPDARPVHAGPRWLASTIPLALSEGMRSLQLELTTMLLGIVAIPASVALFRISVVTATAASTPLVIILSTTTPMIAALHAQDDHRRLQRLVTWSAWGQTAGVFLVSLPLVLIPEQLLPLVFGKGFEAAANATRIVAVGQIVNAAFGPNMALLNMSNQEKRVTRAMFAGLVLNVFTALVLGARYGTVGAASGFVLSLICWNVITWWDAKRILGIETSVLGLPWRQRPSNG